jgi:monoamine oxidase
VVSVPICLYCRSLPSDIILVAAVHVSRVKSHLAGVALDGAVAAWREAGISKCGRGVLRARLKGSAGLQLQFQLWHHHADVAADHVVLAIPFTLLRSVDLSRVPISRLHAKAIREEPLGSNSKLFLQFSSRAWNAEDMTGNCFDDGVVQGGWDATSYQPGKAGVLAALPGGENALSWRRRYGLHGYSGKAPEKMVDSYLRGYDQLFPRVSRKFNGRSYFVWSPGDPHILGAYSYLAVGQYTAFNGIQGVRQGNLHFAGEQTSLDFQGYIEGALRSGYRCAAEVAA